jgi:hypothetical protein
MDRTHTNPEEQNRLPQLKQANQQQSAIMRTSRMSRMFPHLHQPSLACELTLHQV